MAVPIAVPVSTRPVTMAPSLTPVNAAAPASSGAAAAPPVITMAAPMATVPAAMANPMPTCVQLTFQAPLRSTWLTGSHPAYV
nr:hypothetical protein GCM10020092_073900 [Actinoplanes digitatis]